MLTAGCMLILLSFLGCLILCVDRKGKSSRFFDINASNCMRGFWCIIVLLVHIPSAYQNPIQDALGSFAYIGVTFFFMTSGFGLMLKAMSDPDSLKKGFWSRRLPKLLIPALLINAISETAKGIVSRTFDVFSLLNINHFVIQLIFFYFVFWLVFGILPNKISRNVKCVILYASVLLFSLILYAVETGLPFAWPVESLGFAYGVLLAGNKERFTKYFSKKWILKVAIICLFSLILGVAYLKFKYIVFMGEYVLKAILGVSILLFVLLLNVKFPIGNSVCRFFGNISYEVYLTHTIIFSLLSAIFPNLNSGIFILFSIVLTVLFSLIVNRLSALLIGSKKILFRR